MIAQGRMIKEGEALFRAVTEGSAGFVVVHDRNHVMTYASPSARRYGYDPKEMIGRPWMDFIHPQDRSKLQGIIERCQVRPGQSISVGDLRAAGRDGQWRWFEGHLTCLYDEPGIDGNLFIGHDITDRKNAEAALRRSEEEFRNLVEHSFQGIAIFQGAPPSIVYCNNALAAMLGSTREEMLALTGDKAVSWVHPNDLPMVLSRYNDRLAGKKISPAYEFRALRKDGACIHIVGDGQLINYQGQKATVAICHDITDRVRLEENLRRAQKMEAIGTLAAGIAHNLNNILYPIMGYTEMAMEDIPGDSPARNNLAEVLVAVNRASDLVQQILSFARKAGERVKPTELTPLVREVIRLLRAVLPSTIHIRQNVGAESPAVLADPTQAHQVVMNLCTNAFHSMRESGGVLEVALEGVDLTVHDLRPGFTLPPGRYARLSVSDTGRGMEPGVQKRMFEPGFTTKPAGEGTGMGLTEAWEFVKGCGGEILCQSAPGQGACFELWLPAIEQEGGLEKGEAVPRGSEKILLVDDEEQILAMNTQILQRLGYRVTPVMGPGEALELFSRDTAAFDLVITDMTMPFMTGVELAQKMLDMRPGLPIILCTGFSELISGEQARDLGISAFAAKPMSRGRIVQTIREVLKKG